MMGGFATKRRAEEFDALLSSGASGAASEYDDLLDLIASMQDLPEVNPRPEYVATLRERLVAEAAAMPAPAAVDRATAAHLTPAQPTVRHERRLATVLGGFAVASAATSMAVASQGAMPGDALYPVKRAIENAQTGLQGDDTEQVSTLLGHAERRLAEAQRLTAEDAEADPIARALHDLAGQTSEAAELAIRDYRTTGDTTGIEQLHAFSGSAEGELTALSPMVPTDARAALIAAVQTLRTVDAAAADACPTCAIPTASPHLAADFSDLLSAQPSGLHSYARYVEGVAAETPSGTDEPASDPEPGEPAGTASPDTSDEPAGALDPDIETDVDTSDLSDGLESAVDPITTLVDEVTNGLEELHQQTLDAWETLEEDLDSTLDGSSGTE